jgi:GntR family transcriptional repressor for pyruvate dehydrogenase complex
VVLSLRRVKWNPSTGQPTSSRIQRKRDFMFTCAKTGKVSQNIVEQIQNAIIEGALKPGDKLPADRELMERFGVSKGSLREALHSLQVLGFLEIRQGALGGAFVTEVNTEKAKESIANFLAFQNLSLENLFDVRLFLESHIAEKAASMITDDDLMKLEQNILQSHDAIQKNLPLNFREKEIDFHLIIANSTQNALLVFLLDFVENILVDAKSILNPGRDFSIEVLDAHKRVFKALVARNTKQAKIAMIRHIKDVEKALLRIQKEKKISGLRLHVHK